MDRLAPTHREVPSGSRIAIDYSDPAAPVLAVKLQEVFGWSATPMLCDGRVPVTLHLLSPAQRPVQVTRDLAGFWRTSYFDVRKELRGRYPRHMTRENYFVDQSVESRIVPHPSRSSPCAGPAFVDGISQMVRLSSGVCRALCLSSMRATSLAGS